MGESGGDSRMYTPSWNGDPSNWNEYEMQVKLYKMGENLEVSYSLASRLVGRLEGAARRVGLAMADGELHPPANPELKEPAEIRADWNRRGIENVLARLEAELGQQTPQRKGESLESFFAS